MAKIQIDMENRSIVFPTVKLLQPSWGQIKTVAESCYLLKERLGNFARYLATITCNFSQPESAEVLDCNYTVIFMPEEKELIEVKGSIIFKPDLYLEHIVGIMLLQCKEALVSFGIEKDKKDLFLEAHAITF